MKQLEPKKSVLRLMVALAIVLCWMGCEEDEPDTSDLDLFFAQHPFITDPRKDVTRKIEVVPQDATASYPGQKIAFTVLGGKKDYRWAVAIPSRGTIRSTGPNQAIYTVLIAAPNTVIVYDDDGRTGISEIRVALSPLNASASPSSLAANGDKAVLTVSGGYPPYEWTVVDASLGHLVGGNTGASVVYVRDHSGDNAVQVRDQAGNVANVVITQP